MNLGGRQIDLDMTQFRAVAIVFVFRSAFTVVVTLVVVPEPGLPNQW